MLNKNSNNLISNQQTSKYIQKTNTSSPKEVEVQLNFEKEQPTQISTMDVIPEQDQVTPQVKQKRNKILLENPLKSTNCRVAKNT